MKLGWLSDIHLDFLDARGLREFYRMLADAGAGASCASPEIHAIIEFANGRWIDRT
ncbi:MAG: hypothetical protein ABIH26_04180 [Candidatus Eisenbacteria bacterium]